MTGESVSLRNGGIVREGGVVKGEVDCWSEGSMLHTWRHSGYVGMGGPSVKPSRGLAEDQPSL